MARRRLKFDTIIVSEFEKDRLNNFEALPLSFKIPTFDSNTSVWRVFYQRLKKSFRAISNT